EAVGVPELGGVPAAPCAGFDDLSSDPPLVANGCFTPVEDDTIGGVTVGGPLIDFEQPPIRQHASAPRLGAHAAAILREQGMSSDRVAALVDTGVVGRAR